MKAKDYLKYSLLIVVVVVLIKLNLKIFIEPWTKKQIETALNEKDISHIVKIGRVHISIITSGIKLEMIRISLKPDQKDSRGLTGEIKSIELSGIHLWKAVFKRDIVIKKITISNSSLKVKGPYPEEPMPVILSPLNISILEVLLEKTDMSIENTLNAQAFSVKQGVLKLYALKAEKQDTISSGIVKQFDFKADELLSVSSDSMYTFKVSDIRYSGILSKLEITGLSVKPNYKDYDFTSRYKYSRDRIEALFSNINADNFSVADYFKSGSIISSYIEIGNMDLDVFHDSRKKFLHMTRPSFQELIYSFPGTVSIDSISLVNGNIKYTEHDAEANEPGRISFNELDARIYKISNDSVYKTKNAFFELRGEALLMKKGKLTIMVKSKLFDIQNTFSVIGTLSDMEISELNPILEKNAFLYVTSGKLDDMKFSFMANDHKATGRMTLLYHGLDLTLKNKRTDDTTAIKERISSFIANRKLRNSNPVPGEGVREGIISYERDPEKFFFNYCLKSILSGIKSTLVKNR